MASDEMRREIVGNMTPERKQAFLAHIMKPEYRALIDSCSKAMVVWKTVHASAELRWKNTSRTMVLGDPSVRESLWRLADSPAAVECLVYADEQTHAKASLLTLQLALVKLGWMPP